METVDAMVEVKGNNQQVLKRCMELRPLICPLTGLVFLINFLPMAIDDHPPQIWSLSTFRPQTINLEEEASIITSSHLLLTHLNNMQPYLISMYLSVFFYSRFCYSHFFEHGNNHDEIHMIHQFNLNFPTH